MYVLEDEAFSDDARLAGSQTDLDCLLCLVFCVLSQHMLKIISDPSSQCAILTSSKWWMLFAVVGDGRSFFWQMVCCAKTTRIYGTCRRFLCMYCSGPQAIFLFFFFIAVNIYLVRVFVFFFLFLGGAHNYQQVVTQAKQAHNCGDTAAS